MDFLNQKLRLFRITKHRLEERKSLMSHNRVIRDYMRSVIWNPNCEHKNYFKMHEKH